MAEVPRDVRHRPGDKRRDSRRHPVPAVDQVDRVGDPHHPDDAQDRVRPTEGNGTAAWQGHLTDAVAREVDAERGEEVGREFDSPVQVLEVVLRAHRANDGAADDERKELAPLVLKQPARVPGKEGQDHDRDDEGGQDAEPAHRGISSPRRPTRLATG
ncbi:MAG: hypothetical protein U1F14_17205 [Steroidobacteraceae bacterium]